MKNESFTLSLPPPLFSPVLKKVIDYPLKNSILLRTVKMTELTYEILNISRLRGISSFRASSRKTR